MVVIAIVLPYMLKFNTSPAGRPARASISFLALKTRLQNETGIIITVLTPGHMTHTVLHESREGSKEPSEGSQLKLSRQR